MTGEGINAEIGAEIIGYICNCLILIIRLATGRLMIFGCGELPHSAVTGNIGSGILIHGERQ